MSYFSLVFLQMSLFKFQVYIKIIIKYHILSSVHLINRITRWPVYLINRDKQKNEEFNYLYQYNILKNLSNTSEN